MAEIQTPDETLPVEWRGGGELLPNHRDPNTNSGGEREELISSLKDKGGTPPVIGNSDGQNNIYG